MAVAVITGSAGGLGKRLVERFADEGHRVLALDVVAQADTHRENVLALGVDVTDPGDVERAVQLVQARFGPVDVVVNNAALQITGDLLDTSIEDFRAVVDVNLVGSFVVAQAGVRAMIAAGRKGSLVNIGSVLGFVGDGDLVAYTSSKAGVLGLTRAIAVKYAAHGIRCNAVCPGDIETTMSADYAAAVGVAPDALAAHYPMGRIATPDDVAELVLFLASSRSAYATGQSFVVDGGLLANCY